MKKRIKYKLEKKQHVMNDLVFHNYCEEEKKNFQKGPWNKELNKIYFKAHGFDCMVKRVGYLGTLCGYVGVPKGHPMFNVSWNSEKCLELNVHGGITYSNECQDDICHPGKHKVFWLGFDCGHAGDYIPKLTPKVFGEMPYHEHLKKDAHIPAAAFVKDIYRDVSYVKEECARLAKQLKDIA